MLEVLLKTQLCLGRPMTVSSKVQDSSASSCLVHLAYSDAYLLGHLHESNEVISNRIQIVCCDLGEAHRRLIYNSSKADPQSSEINCRRKIGSVESLAVEESIRKPYARD